MGRSKRSGQDGVSLLEVLVVLALAITFQAVAAPAMGKLTDSFRLTASANSLFTGLQLARSEAIARNSRVVLCKSPTGEQCVSTGGWHEGWMVFNDVNNNASRDPGEELLLREQPSSSPLRLTGNSTVANYVSYTGLGMARHTSGAFQAGTFTVCVPSTAPSEARQLVLSNTGRVRTTRLTVSHCG